MSENNGGPAFPSEQGHIPDGTWNPTYDPGMTLRDYFAAHALQGFLANSKFSPTQFDPIDNASYIFKVADAMIAKRDK